MNAGSHALNARASKQPHEHAHAILTQDKIIITVNFLNNFETNDSDITFIKNIAIICFKIFFKNVFD
jgi:hypothetical protein